MSQNKKNNNDEIIIIIGTMTGLIICLLSGVGLFVIPGLRFIYNSGSVVGGLTGFIFGMILGGIITVLIRMRGNLTIRRKT